MARDKRYLESNRSITSVNSTCPWQAPIPDDVSPFSSDVA